jgi:polyisoprenoid-binding protein YceI
MHFKKLVITSSLLVSTLFAGTYNVDKSHSNVGFEVKHLMISNIKGKFDNFTGTFEYDEKTNTIKSLAGTIEVASINTDEEERDDHLKSADFFDAAKYENITFKLEKIKKDKAFGKLTIHGITKDVELAFENNGTIKDPWGNDRVGLALNGKINRFDYGLKYNSALEAGGVVVGDMVKLNIEIEGIKQK